MPDVFTEVLSEGEEEQKPSEKQDVFSQVMGVSTVIPEKDAFTEVMGVDPVEPGVDIFSQVMGAAPGPSPHLLEPGILAEPDKSDPFSSVMNVRVDPIARRALQKEVSALERTAEDAGVLDQIGQKALSVLGPVIDILGTTNYASAGAVDVFLEGMPEEDKERVTARLRTPQQSIFFPEGRVQLYLKALDTGPTILKNLLMQGVASPQPFIPAKALIKAVAGEEGDTPVERIAVRESAEIMAGLASLENLKATVINKMIPFVDPVSKIPIPEAAERKAFDEVLEDFGVGKLGQLSRDVPFLFNETGKDIVIPFTPVRIPQFQKGGLLDFTSRGTISLGADIIADPLTYTTLGVGGGAKTGLYKGGREFARRVLTKKGSRELAEHMRRAGGFTDQGNQALRAGIYSETQVVNDVFNLQNASDSVRAAFRKVTERDAIPSSLKLSEFTPTELAAVVKQQRLAGEMSLSNMFLSNPEKYAWIFDDGGLKFLGQTIPGTGDVQRWMSQLSADGFQKISDYFVKHGSGPYGNKYYKAVLEGSRRTAGLYKSITGIFRADRTNDAVARAVFQGVTDRVGMVQTDNLLKLNKAIGGGEFDMSPASWETLVNTIDVNRRIIGLLAASAGKTHREIFGNKELRETVLGQLSRMTQAQLRTFRPTGVLKKKQFSEDQVRRLADFAIDFAQDLDNKEFIGFRRDLRSIGLSDIQIQQLDKDIAAAVKRIAEIDGGPPLSLANLETQTGLKRAQGAAVKFGRRVDPDQIADEVVKKSELDGLLNEISEVKPGIPRPDQVEALRTYATQQVARTYLSNLPIFFRNRSGNITQAVRNLKRAFSTEVVEDTLLGSHRAMYTGQLRHQVADQVKKARRADPTSPNIEMVSDLREILEKRVALHTEDYRMRELQNAVKAFDIDQLPFEARHGLGFHPSGSRFYHVLRGLDTTAEDVRKMLGDKGVEDVDKLHTAWVANAKVMKDQEARTVSAISRTPKGDPLPSGHQLPKTLYDKFGKFSREQKRYFLAKEFLDANTRRDVQNIMARYVDFIAEDPGISPRFSSLRAMREADFGSSRALNLKGSVVEKIAEVPADIFDHVTSMRSQLIQSRELAKVLGFLDKPTGWFKALVTAPFPAFHYRNIYGNVANAFTEIGLSAFNPRTHRIAAGVVLRGLARSARGRKGLRGLPRDMIRAAEGLVDINHASQYKLVTKLGEVYDIPTIEKLAKELGVWTDAHKLFELAGQGQDAVTGKLSRLSKKAQNLLFGPGTQLENEARIQLFVEALRKGLSPEDAAAKVKRALFDYDHLSPIERHFFRRVQPFYVWWTRNLALQTRNLIKQPGKAAAQFKALRSGHEDMDVLSTKDVDGTVMRLDRDGKNLTVLTGVDLPVTGLSYFDSLLGNSRRQRELLASINPLLRMFVEIPTNTSIFTGRPLDKTESQAVGRVIEKIAPQGVKDWIGYRKNLNKFTGKIEYEFDGKRFFALFETWALSRMVRSSDRAWDKNIKTHPNNDLLQWFLTATQTQKLHLDIEDFKKLQQRKRDLEEVLTRRGVLEKYKLTVPAPEETEYQ
jgi:hypothetical protein